VSALSSRRCSVPLALLAVVDFRHELAEELCNPQE
jgi:hypothetical protein